VVAAISKAVLGGIFKDDRSGAGFCFAVHEGVNLLPKGQYVIIIYIYIGETPGEIFKFEMIVSYSTNRTGLPARLENSLKIRKSGI